MCKRCKRHPIQVTSFEGKVLELRAKTIKDKKRSSHTSSLTLQLQKSINMPVKMSSADVTGNPPKAAPSLKTRTYNSHNKTHAIQIPIFKLPFTQLLKLQSTLQSSVNLEADQAMLSNDDQGEKTVILLNSRAVISCDHRELILTCTF